MIRHPLLLSLLVRSRDEGTPVIMGVHGHYVPLFPTKNQQVRGLVSRSGSRVEAVGLGAMPGASKSLCAG